MGRNVGLLAAVLALASAPVRGEGHLVSPDAVAGRLKASSVARAEDRHAVDRVLASPVAERAARALGVDIGDVRKGVATLSDADLRNLAARAAALEVDPAAGLDRDIHDLLIIFLIVAIVLVVLKAV